MSTQPNILFLFPDQHRPDWGGWNPDLPLRTPHLDFLGSRGVRFTRAVTPSPLCSPARACLATGMDYERCGVRGNGQNTSLDRPTYYRHLRDAGYRVAGVGKFDLHKADLDWGLDGSMLLEEYGFTEGIDNEGKGDAVSSTRKNGGEPVGPYMHYLKERGLLQTHLDMYEGRKGLNFEAVTNLPEEAYCDNWIGGNALQFLDAFPEGRPWHLVVNFTGPHDPYDVTPAMRDAWKDVDIPPPVDHPDPGEASIRIRRQNYAAMIENIDAWAGRLIEKVAARGELENTLIVYASDHGEMLGDHGRWQKSVWYTPSAGIPLIVAGPGVQEGVVSEALVSLHDLAATYLEAADAEVLPGSDARSLWPLLRGYASRHRDVACSALCTGNRNWRMVTDGRYKLVLNKGEPPLLYDLKEDPDEISSCAGTHPEEVSRLSRIMHEKREGAKPSGLGQSNAVPKTAARRHEYGTDRAK